MKKKVLAIMLVALIAIPLFAFGSKESSTNATPASTNTTTSSETTATALPTTMPVADSISTPVYRVELNGTYYVTQEDIDSAKEYIESVTGLNVSVEDAEDYVIKDVLFNQVLSKAIEEGEIPLYDGQFQDYVSYQLVVLGAQYGYQIETEENANDFLALLGVSFSDFANNFVQEFAKDYYVQLKSNGKFDEIEVPTEQDVKEFYSANMSAFVVDESAKVAHIFFAFGSDKETALVKANTALNNLNKGLSWKDAVKTYSEDKESVEAEGAIDIWISASDPYYEQIFGADAIKEIFKLKKGQTSGVVEGAQGYHIFKMTDHNDAKLLALTDLYDANYEYTLADVIAQNIYSQRQSVVYEQILEEIIDAAKAEATIESLK